MNAYIDVKYINLVSSSLDYFKTKRSKVSGTSVVLFVEILKRGKIKQEDLYTKNRISISIVVIIATTVQVSLSF